MKLFLLFLVGLVPCLTQAQFSVTGMVPSNGSTSVPTHTTLIIAFSAAVDTTVNLEQQEAVFTSVDSAEGMWYSPSLDTLYVQAVLPPNTAQFVYVYGMHSATGQALSSPAVSYFTTGSVFPPYSVNGTVQSGTSGVDPAGAAVVLSPEPLGDGPPEMRMGAIADGSGAFTVPYLEDGIYYPIAAKDANGDGLIRPEEGDPLAVGDPVVVSGGNVTGVVLEFMTLQPVVFSDAWNEVEPEANAMLPSDKVLRFATADDADTAGRSWGWGFAYTSDSAGLGWFVMSSPFGTQVEQGGPLDYLWMSQFRPMPSPGGAAPSSVFVGNAEAAGGATFRASLADSLTLYIQLSLGDATQAGFGQIVPDPSAFYWGARYVYGYQPDEHTFFEYGSKMFIGAFDTGEILVITGVEKEGQVPDEVSLLQNYPNPFNPSTSIQFSLPSQSDVRLEVVDVLGQSVAMLISGTMEAGTHQARWDAQTASGVYFARLTATPLERPELRTVKMRKMLLLH
jgi:hypothetical protein